MQPVRLNIKGRGAAYNTPNRFEPTRFEPDAEILDAEDQAPPPQTVYIRDHAKTIIATNDSPDIPFRFSVNPYRGCSHGCVYCFARPGHEYLGYSAGLDFETKVVVKEDAPELLRKELSAPKWQPALLAISGVTDCYQPAERKYELTRRCLQVCAEFRNPVGLITKNHLITRDLDVLAELASFNGVAAILSVTTLKPELTRTLEPRTSTPARRLAAIETLAAAGVPVGVMVAPVIPGLTDEEMPSILRAAKNAGATFAGFVPLRLPLAVAPLFVDWLERHLPDRKDKVLNRVRSMRGGALYRSEWGKRLTGEGPFAEQISAMFNLAVRRVGLGDHPELSTEHFRRPGEPQLSLFE